MRTAILVTLGAGVAALQACASTPGARPQDMSSADHERAAGAADSQAATHDAQYNPNGQVKTSDCAPYGGCWTSLSNPTTQHTEEAEKYHKMAADHRAASQALRDAEGRACAGLSNYDRDVSPFAHLEDIQGATGSYTRLETDTEGVGPVYVHSTGKHPGDRLVGATVNFQAVRGLTAEWLQRVVDCHIARNSAMGNVVPDMPYCPLVPKGASAKVSSVGNGFAVTIESSDSQTATEILRRATALKGGN